MIKRPAILKRSLKLQTRKNYLLLGPRRVGKTTYLRTHFPNCETIDLLKRDVFFEYRTSPHLLRERYLEGEGTIIIDEIQLIPDLLYEVHWMIENTGRNFILSGSSARKLRRTGVTNLAGRLASVHMVPLTHAEIPDFDLHRQLQFGSLPPILFSENPAEDLKNYCGEYLKEEIQSEGIVRNLPSFTRFLESAALSNAEMISYTSQARDCGVAAKTIKAYYQILVDTLLGYMLEAFTKTKKRRAITTPKFYFFDCALPNTILERTLSPKTPEFGKAFEHYLLLETIAAMRYGKRISKLQYWRSASGFEVDLIINEHTAVEFKTGSIHIQDTKSLLALDEEIPLKNKWIVGLENKTRTLENGVVVLPWQEFLNRLQQIDSFR